MHSPKRRTVIRALTAIAMSCFAIAPKASGIPTFDGANFAQQLLSVMNQTQQLTQQTTMVQQNLANLQRLGGNVLSLADQAYSGQGVSMRDLVSSVSDLYQAGKQLQGMYDAASAEMKSLNMTPERWGTAFVHLAQTKGGVYRKQLDQDFATMEASRRVLQIYASCPARFPALRATSKACSSSISSPASWPANSWRCAVSCSARSCLISRTAPRKRTSTSFLLKARNSGTTRSPKKPRTSAPPSER